MELTELESDSQMRCWSIFTAEWMQFSFTNSCCYCYTDKLLEQVLSVIHKTGSLKKISFTAHSLGGLIARYTIAVLYSSDTLQKDLNDGYKTGNPENLERSSKLGSIGGLEPINFITLGTPHLGFIGKRQVNSSVPIHSSKAIIVVNSF